MGAQTEETRWHQGTLSRQEQLGKNFGKQSDAPQACGVADGLCGPVPHQDVTYLPGYDSYPNLDEEMVARAHVVDAMSNFKMTQVASNRIYLYYQCDTFRIYTVLVYWNRSKIFMDMDAYVYMKQKKSIQDD